MIAAMAAGRRAWMSAAVVGAVLGIALGSGCEPRKRRPRLARRPALELDASTAPAPVDPGSNAPAPVAEPPKISLSEAGAAPRRQLLVHLAAGQRDEIEVRLQIQAHHAIADAPAPEELKLPGLRFALQFVVSDVRGEDRISSEFKLTDTEVTDEEGVDPLILSSTKADAAKAIGMTGAALVDRRGFRRNVRLDIPDGVSDQMKQMLTSVVTSIDQLTAPFPGEPIGIGARWEHYQTLVQNGMQIRQTTLFELTSLDGDRGTVKATIKQAAERQPAFLPGLPMGVEAELLSLSSTGSGEVEFDLGRQAPTRASISIATDSAFAIKTGGQTQSMTQQATMVLTIESVSP